jgi:amino acid transporter
MDFITARNAFSQIEQAGQLLVNHPALAVLDHFRQAPNAADLPQILTALKGLPASPEAVEAIKHFSISPKVVDAYNAWAHAPMLGSIRIIFDLPAFAIVSLITAIIYIGIQESKNLSNAMVAIKLIVIIFIIVMGFFYINPENWNPFAPEGFGGVMKGVSAVFFAYIGFDAISTTAEEAKDPRRDLPRAMIYSLVICTVLYVLLALTLTGMVHYKLLDVGDPLAFAFEQAGLPPSIKGIVVFLVSASAIVAMTSVLLVFQIGQPRIWLSMSRDGLLPPIFGRIHPKFRTPSFSTILTGITVSIPCMFMNLNEAADLTSIGTLFAFVLVCGGVLKMQMDGGNTNATFKVPYVNGKFILPALVLVFFGYVFLSAAGVVGSIVSATAVSDGQAVLNFLMLNAVPEQSAGEELYHGLPLFLFLIVTLAVSVLAFRNSLSLFPCLGLISCLYLMSFVDIQSWIRFLMWLFIGQIIYFLYGRQHSKLNNLPAA